ncbi:MAG: hypothetical protein CL946_12520 [Ectothiorhodospiraceae bacterium]|nr:hypothetical protein [Ectothiorhodospiraceae bacterium]
MKTIIVTIAMTLMGTICIAQQHGTITLEPQRIHVLNKYYSGGWNYQHDENPTYQTNVGAWHELNGESETMRVVYEFNQPTALPLYADVTGIRLTLKTTVGAKSGGEDHSMEVTLVSEMFLTGTTNQEKYDYLVYPATFVSYAYTDKDTDVEADIDVDFDYFEG